MASRTSAQPAAARAIWFALGALVVYQLRYVLAPFVAAGALCFIAYPAVRWLERRWRWPHLLAVVGVFVLIVGTIAGMFALFGWLAFDDIHHLAQNAPERLHQVAVQILGGEKGTLLGKQLTADELAGKISSKLSVLIGTEDFMGYAAAVVASVGAGVLLTIVLFFYFLFSRQRLLDGLLWLCPPDKRPKIRAWAAEIEPVLGHYVRGLLMVFLYTSLAAWVGIQFLLGLPHAVLLALLTGLLELVPVVGPVVSATMVGLVALERGSVGMLVAAVGLCIGLRLSIDQVIGPLVLGRAVTLHPAVILFSLLCGGVLYGLLGAFLAIPVAASIKVILAKVYAENAEDKPLRAVKSPVGRAPRG